MRNKILITGATGFVGQAVVNHLYRKRPLVCLVRDKKKDHVLKKLPVKIVYGDILDPKSLIKTTQKADKVIHLAATHAGHIQKGLGSYQDNITGMKNLVNACQKNQVKKIIFISTNSVNYASGGYAQSKKGAEKLLRQSGLNFTIFRPTLIYGFHSTDIQKLLKIIQAFPLIPIVGKGKNRCQPLFIKDFTLALEACLDNPKTNNQTYTLGGKDAITIKEMINHLQSLSGTQKKTISLPTPACLILARLTEKLLPRLGFTQERIESLTSDIPVDNQKAQKDLNWQPRSFAKGLEELKKDL
jgi:NADH dehydrogenase